MKKALAQLIHYLSPTYFERKTYDYLSRWGIDDIYDGKIVWDHE